MRDGSFVVNADDKHLIAEFDIEITAVDEFEYIIDPDFELVTPVMVAAFIDID